MNPLIELWPDVSGLNILEFGTDVGAYTLELKRRGAQVEAYDICHTENTAELLKKNDIPYFSGLQYDLDYPLKLGKVYDGVLFMNILYHLRNPVMGLENARWHCKPNGWVYVESAVEQGEAARFAALREGYIWTPALERPHAKDITNFFMFNMAAVAHLCRLAGLQVIRELRTPGDYPAAYPRGGFLCRPVAGWKPASLSEGMEGYWRRNR